MLRKLDHYLVNVKIRANIHNKLTKKFLLMEAFKIMHQ